MPYFYAKIKIFLLKSMKKYAKIQKETKMKEKKTWIGLILG